MPKLKGLPEAFFMNELPFALRNAAKDLYRQAVLSELVAFKKGKVPQEWVLRYQLDQAQWQQIADAVILARLPQFRILNHFNEELLEHLNALVLDSLQMPDYYSCAEAATIIERDAPTLANWMQHLHKLLSSSRQA